MAHARFNPPIRHAAPRRPVLAVLTALAAACSPLSHVAAAPSPAALAESRTALDAAVRLADWQLGRMAAAPVSRATSETDKPRAWEQAVFWIGMTALADAGGPPRIREAILAMG